jgi:inosine/xanthosine triphosphate pyrophosphatase family protein
MLYPFVIKQFEFDAQEIQSFSQKEVCLSKVRQADNVIKKPIIVNDTDIFIKNTTIFPVFSRNMSLTE